MADEVKLSMIVTNDAMVQEWKWDDGMSWLITEEQTNYSSMSDADFKNAILQLEAGLQFAVTNEDLESSDEDTAIFTTEMASVQSNLMELVLHVLVTSSMTQFQALNLKHLLI